MKIIIERDYQTVLIFRVLAIQYKKCPSCDNQNHVELLRVELSYPYRTVEPGELVLNLSVREP